MSNLSSLLLDHPFPDSAGLLHTASVSVTAGSARASVRALASQVDFLSPGSAVAVQLPNGPDAVIAMAAVWAAGFVFVPVNPRYPPAEVDHVLSQTRPGALISSSGIAPLSGAVSYAPDDAFVLWTSGTSGAPKPIVHTHTAYLELLDRVLDPLRGGSGDRSPAPNLIPVSLALNAGIYNTLFGLRAGAAIVIMESFSTASFASLVRRFSIRSTVLPPAAITMLNDDASITDLAPLKYVRSITAPLSPLQAQRFTAKFGVFVLNGYGQAEIGEVIGWTAADAKAFPLKVGAAGRPHPGVSVKLVDGRLWVRPPNRAADLDSRVDAFGFVDTGDMARIDEDGFVWIEGRASDVINRGGNKVFPDDVEEVLRLIPGVTDAGVVGAVDGRLGEVPVAFYTGSSLAASVLADACRARLAPYKVPVRFIHVADLPRNEAGKLRRRELRAQL